MGDVLESPSADDGLGNGSWVGEVTLDGNLDVWSPDEVGPNSDDVGSGDP